MKAENLPIVNRKPSILTIPLQVGNITTMEKAISAADANRRFSQLLRDVKDGQSYVVTSHGRAVARIAPFEKGGTTTASARASLLGRLRSEKVVRTGRWKRDELYE
jgi:prevent-host-death family protein